MTPRTWGRQVGFDASLDQQLLKCQGWKLVIQREPAKHLIIHSFHQSNRSLVSHGTVANNTGVYENIIHMLLL